MTWLLLSCVAAAALSTASPARPTADVAARSTALGAAGAKVGAVSPEPAAVADDARFVEAIERMRALDYEGAIALFDAMAAEPRDDVAHVTLLLYSGAARALLGDEGAARLAFEGALRIDRDAVLPLKTSPKVFALFQELKDRLPAVALPTPLLTTPPTAAPTKAAPLAPTSSSAAVPLGVVLAGVGVVATLGLGGAAAYFGINANRLIAAADDKGTSQQAIAGLVDQANASLAIAVGLGAGAVVALGAGAASLFSLE